MKHDAFRGAWEDALRTAGILKSHDNAEECVDIGTMSRKYLLRVGAFHNQPAEPFTGSLELSWEWDALLSARTSTSESDMLTELLGRDEVPPTVTERPWLRVDLKLHGKLAWDGPLLLARPETWRAWVADVAKHVSPQLPEPNEEPGREGVVGSWLGEPKAQLRCGPAGELWLLGVGLAGWQAIVLPRQGDGFEDAPDDGPEAQLEVLAGRLAKALAAWKKSLRLLLPKSTQLH